MTGHPRMQENVIEVAKTAPPVTVGALTFLGVDMDTMIQVLSLLWLIALLAEKLWGWVMKWRAKRIARKRAMFARRRAIQNAAAARRGSDE